MAQRKGGEELKAGIAVLVALVILAGGLFYISGGREQFIPKRDYTILFRDGGGVSPGTPVELAGSKVGDVQSVDFTSRRQGDKLIRYVSVIVSIDAEREIPVDSLFTVSKSITNIVTFSIRHGTSPELADEKTELFGERLATFEEAIHEGKLLLGDARKAVSKLDSAIEKVDRQVGEFDVGALQGKAEAFLDSLNRSGGEVENLIGDARPKVDAAMTSVVDGAADLRTLLGKLREDWGTMEPKVQAALDNLESATVTVKGILEENRGPVRSAMQGLDDGARRLGPALERLEELGKEAKETVVELRPQLMGTVRRARTAMANFEALTEDLKTAPWKLVNKPSGKEVREVALYNAARLYVGAAAKLNRMVEDLDTLRRLGVLQEGAQTELVGKVLAELEQSLADFEEREKQLVGQMLASR